MRFRFAEVYKPDIVHRQFQNRWPQFTMNANRAIGEIVKFHLRALRVLRGNMFIHESIVGESKCWRQLFDQRPGELFPASNTIDQSGLSVSYSSLVDDFDNFISMGPTTFHDFGDSVWGASSGVRSGNFDFLLGGSFTIQSMALWNLVADPSSIREFRLLLDDNPDFSSPVNVGSFTAENALGDPLQMDTAAQVFNFSATEASHVRLEILNTHSPESFSSAFNEVAF